MNPLHPLMKLLKAVGYLIALPFMVIQGIWMLFTGLLSVTVYLLVFSCILAAFAALIGAPFVFFGRSHRHAEQVESAYAMTGEFDRGASAWVWHDPNTHLGHKAPSIVEYVGPRGVRIHFEPSRLMKPSPAPAPPDVPAPPPRVVAEIDNDDVDFHELRTAIQEMGSEVAIERTKVAKELAEQAVIVELRAAEQSLAAAESGLVAADDEEQERPEWVDAIFSSEEELSKVRVEAGPCVSREACEMAYRNAQDEAISEFVRDRSNICLADLGITTMPWHEMTVQRIAQNLRLPPVDEFVDTHDVALAGEVQRTYFKYGLLEFSPQVRDHIDREITRWARSFLAGGMWGLLLAGIGSAYLLLQFDGWRKLAGVFSRRRTATLAVATVLGLALAALTAIM